MTDKQRIRILLFEKISIYVLFFISLSGGLLFGYILSEVKGSQTINLLTQYKPSTPTVLYDVNGEDIMNFHHTLSIVFWQLKIKIFITILVSIF
jgi:membrane carboxypeptidase/penicillin-binding protein